eukprot:Plantae.Rhodophyta-Hildenbrandia_rubra.ctg10619.p1 GENE.Plantae.Rhodophyta-Hildenbrandia_rubra.ctg10619~~Plantae.Rhodophyta-Hildenbrandia_rubra.ctg10619.p1  ORF type:complete len:321 (-),score=56.15 Plantae.Rhodophyta-Hildenbrandia_rubra.ctg10619:1290-2252(-)
MTFRSLHAPYRHTQQKTHLQYNMDVLDVPTILMRWTMMGIVGGSIDAAIATRKLHHMLEKDGYCCVILAKDSKEPLTFPEDVPNGNHVVAVSPLDYDLEQQTEHKPVAGTIFSVYKRKSSASLSGQRIDLLQKAKDQVAAGYCVYSSATTLHYTMGHGLYSFVMHPVALQYFLQPAMRVTLPENPSAVYGERRLVKKQEDVVGKCIAKSLDKHCGSMYGTGCLVGDVHLMLQNGGIVVGKGSHFLCEAAPLAFLIEQAGGVAVDANGKRILNLQVLGNFDMKTTLVAGSPITMKNVGLCAQRPVNGGAQVGWIANKVNGR